MVRPFKISQDLTLHKILLQACVHEDVVQALAVVGLACRSDGGPVRVRFCSVRVKESESIQETTPFCVRDGSREHGFNRVKVSVAILRSQQLVDPFPAICSQELL
jgi:hypothetical protein